jgi:hypothetical protein
MLIPLPSMTEHSRIRDHEHRYFRGRGPVAWRRNKGSSLSEFGPALFFILFFALFPVLNMISLGYGYLSSATLNDLQLREAAKVPKSQATDQSGAVLLTIPQRYLATVTGGISGLKDLPQTNLSYTLDASGAYVTVATTVNLYPLLTIPFFPGVPGVGAPATVTVTSTRVLENPQFAGE